MAIQQQAAISAEVLGLLFARAGVGLCFVAPNLTVLRANAEWLRWSGYAAERIEGEDILAVFPDTRELALSFYERVQRGETVSVPRHGERVLGREVWWEGQLSPVPMETGTGILFTMRDAAEQRQAPAGLDAETRRLDEIAEEQRALRDQLAKVAASVPGVVCSYRLRPDGTACMPFTTPAAEDLYGIPREVLAEDFGPLMANVHPEDRQRVVEVLGEAARARSRWHDVFRYRHPAKGVRWLEGWSVPAAEPDGSLIWHGYVMDVTERKRAEEALREADRLKTEFLGVLSHELRNPLAPIRNSIYLLERAPPGSEKAARAKEVIRRQTEHLTRLVDDLLDVTRISRGKIELQRSRVDLREVVARTCDDHRTLFDGRHIELRVELAGPVWIEADATRIAQVVGNLLQNAAKFSREGGAVAVAVGVATEGGRAEIRVRDDGVGVPAELLPRIFEPFVQADEGLARTRGGLGLGLALVRGLVELHGGGVRADSEGAGRGSEFVVTLPVAPGPPEPPLHPAVRANVRSVDILVIEDNVDAAQTIAEVLQMEGHRVHVATDGLSGIAKARELRPELVLCDIGLPDVDGYEVARELRADASLRGMRLIALSGYAQPEDKARAKEAGFEAHLGKPAHLDELTALVARRG
ncbi:hybrid sensor histidine kinase/response regulator [Anaeromyxobacter terrae]|uniref:hybrid sensor histidine kinase/response regulator n=1 Tax=Anaeromyxobacter terrae TaxID=2925406 RepID=UPI001F563013|nr:ATP-binding protein [Anaeromyxobacter sp. SG22]